jgi:hypothetical protein
LAGAGATPYKNKRTKIQRGAGALLCGVFRGSPFFVLCNPLFSGGILRGTPLFILPKFNTMKKSILFSLGFALFFIYAGIATLQNYGAIYAFPFIVMAGATALLFSGVMDYYKK